MPKPLLLARTIAARAISPLEPSLPVRRRAAFADAWSPDRAKGGVTASSATGDAGRHVDRQR